MMSGCARPPIETAKDSFLDIKGVHQGDDVERKHGRLAIPEGVAGEEARRPIAAQIGDNHPVAGRRQQRRDIDKAVYVVGPSVQQNDRRAVDGASFGVL